MVGFGSVWIGVDVVVFGLCKWVCLFVDDRWNLVGSGGGGVKEGFGVVRLV